MTPDPAVAVQATRLTKTFHTAIGPVTAVSSIDLLVRRGETYGLIGPDGAGKTTTLRLLLGLLTRTSGASTLLGFDPLRSPYAVRERVGYIAQQFALPADLTVAENMRFFADVHGVSLSDRRQRIPALLDFAGLSRFTTRLSGRLSGGMKKKLALACSLVHQPALLLLDEPTLGVDPVSRREFWSLLAGLRADQGLTLLVSTPYMDEAERCDRVGLIYRGALVADDTPAAVKRLLPGALLEFTPSDLRAALPLVAALPGVADVQTFGPMLHALVDHPDLRAAEIVAALAARSITCAGLRPVEPRMEDAFISLIRRREAHQ